MTQMRDRLKSVGISEARLSALGMGAPSTPAPTATAEPPNAFRTAWDAHNASANVPKPRPIVDAKSAGECVELFKRYRVGNFAERAFIRLHREAELETGRRLFVEPNEPPEPEAA